MERWREGSEDPEVWSMEDRRLVESYRITIRENGMVVLSQRELMKERERKLERRKNSLSRKELFAELDKVVEEQEQEQEQELKSVIEEKKEENSVENTPLNDDDDDRCLEIAIEEAKQEAAEMNEEMKNKKKKRRGRRGKPKEEKGNKEGRKGSDTTQEVVCEPSKGEHLRIYGLLEGDVKLVYKILHRLVEVCDLGSIVTNIRTSVGGSVRSGIDSDEYPSDRSP